jgi:sporulation integral membrane protein YlbJ
MNDKSAQRINIPIFICASLLIILSFVFPDIMLQSAVSGLDLCGRAIIPSLFPFMIFSDMLIASNAFFSLPESFKSAFERLFKLPSQAFSALLMGVICGFPIGVKAACELYQKGELNKDECENLMCFCNNTGPAFVIAGVGVSMRKSPTEGILLYFVQVICALICGLLLAKKGKSSSAECKKVLNSSFFSVPESIKSASFNIVCICGFVTFFSIICGFVSIAIKNDILRAAIASILEVGNACKFCAKIKISSLSFALSAAAISFSGFSVHMQAAMLAKAQSLNMSKYYIFKIIQAFLSFAIAFVIYNVFLQ